MRPVLSRVIRCSSERGPRRAGEDLPAVGHGAQGRRRRRVRLVDGADGLRDRARLRLPPRAPCRSSSRSPSPSSTRRGRPPGQGLVVVPGQRSLHGQGEPQLWRERRLLLVHQRLLAALAQHRAHRQRACHRLPRRERDPRGGPHAHHGEHPQHHGGDRRHAREGARGQGRRRAAGPLGREDRGRR